MVAQVALTHQVRVRILGGGQIKNMDKDINLKEKTLREETLKEFNLLLQDNKTNIQNIVDFAEDAGFTNEQCYIEWEDFLNEISVKQHPECNGYIV